MVRRKRLSDFEREFIVQEQVAGGGVLIVIVTKVTSALRSNEKNQGMTDDYDGRALL